MIVQGFFNSRVWSGQVVNGPKSCECLKGGQGGLVALVSHATASAVEGQFEVLAGENTEGDGHAGLLGNGADTAGDLVVDVLVVSRFALDNCTQTDHRVELSRVGQPVCDDRDLKRPGHWNDQDLVVGNAVLGESGEGGVAESFGDVVVVLRHDHRKTVFGAGVG